MRFTFCKYSYTSSNTSTLLFSILFSSTYVGVHLRTIYNTLSLEYTFYSTMQYHFKYFRIRILIFRTLKLNWAGCVYVCVCVRVQLAYIYVSYVSVFIGVSSPSVCMCVVFLICVTTLSNAQDKFLYIRYITWYISYVDNI